jgi:hypothetical protein
MDDYKMIRLMGDGINGGITNMNLGSYQINYKKYPNPKAHEYFIDATEREHTNIILTNLVKKHGYSWETIDHEKYSDLRHHLKCFMVRFWKQVKKHRCCTYDLNWRLYIYKPF